MGCDLKNFLSVIRCPISGTALRIEGSHLISEEGHHYPIVNGKPILIRLPTELNLTVPDKSKISQNIPTYNLPDHYGDSPILALHHGSGNVACEDPRVISVDLLPNENVDIVAEAEALPFHDCTFDYVESGAVFEHIFDISAAIAEIKRILKPSGLFRIDTAFMQAFHGFPSHYCNLTPLAAESLLIDDFILRRSQVPDSATPIKTLVDILERFLSYLPGSLQREAFDTKVGDLIVQLKADMTSQSTFLQEFSEYAMRSMAASCVVIGEKPEDYEEKRKALNAFPRKKLEWETAKRDYYALRMEIMFLHHQIGTYKTVTENFGFLRNLKTAIKNFTVVGTFSIPDPLPIAVILESAKVNDPLSKSGFDGAIEVLNEHRKTLSRIRELWLAVYAQNGLPIPVTI